MGSGGADPRHLDLSPVVTAEEPGWAPEPVSAAYRS